VTEAGEALAGLRGEAVDLADALARVPVECGCVRAGLAAAMGGGSDEGAVKEAEAGVKFLPVAGLLPAGRAVLGAVEARLELGFRTFKWKVGVGEAADEWAILDGLLGALPKGAKLRLDANGAWSRKVAEGWLARAAERPMIEYVEQPCFAEASQGAAEQRKVDALLRGLAADFPVKIALDESIAGARDVEKWLAADWQGVWVIKPALLGEPGAVLENLARAKADVVFGSALETGVGARAGLRLAFAWAEREGRPAAERRALGYGVWPLFGEDAANAPWSGPFVRREDVERINPEALWNALS
jgi:O-succinylbenzoate synthase